MVVWNSHIAENYYHKPGRCSAICSFHVRLNQFLFKGITHIFISKLFTFGPEKRSLSAGLFFIFTGFPPDTRK